MSKLTDYGIVLLIHMAKEPAGGLHTARDLAELARLPQPTVSKLLKELSKAGLLVSHRGRRGGYSLARPAEAITVSEIVAALEGPVALSECSSHSDPGCAQEPHCPARGHWQLISRAVEGALDGLRLSSMIAPAESLGAPIALGVRWGPSGGAA